MTRPSLVPSPCGTLWNVLLVKENHNPFIGFSFSKVKFNHILGIYSSDVPNFCFNEKNIPKLQIPSQNFSKNNLTNIICISPLVNKLKNISRTSF